MHCFFSHDHRTMGLYINQLADGTYLPSTDKAAQLIASGAKVIPAPTKREDWQENMVCVVENGIFDAAGYADTPNEMMAFSQPQDHRAKTWLIVPDAAKIAK
jgi:hypothetical protein